MTALGKNPFLLILVIALIFDIGIYNTLGVAVTKYASCSNRATVNTCKVVLVWIIFLILGAAGVPGGEHFQWLQLGGFILIVIGTFMFNYQRNEKLTEVEYSFISESSRKESIASQKNTVNVSDL